MKKTVTIRLTPETIQKIKEMCLKMQYKSYSDYIEETLKERLIKEASAEYIIAPEEEDDVEDLKETRDKSREKRYVKGLCNDLRCIQSQILDFYFFIQSEKVRDHFWGNVKEQIDCLLKTKRGWNVSVDFVLDRLTEIREALEKKDIEEIFKLCDNREKEKRQLKSLLFKYHPCPEKVFRELQ